jgi:hypothetical protein
MAGKDRRPDPPVKPPVGGAMGDRPEEDWAQDEAAAHTRRLGKAGPLRSQGKKTRAATKDTISRRS